MALSIKTERADRLARELTALTGETITEAVEKSLEERLERETASRRRRKPGQSLADWVDEWRKGLISKGYDLERRLTKEEEIELLGDETDLRLLEEERAAKRKSDAA